MLYDGGFRPISWAGGSTESRPTWIGRSDQSISSIDNVEKNAEIDSKLGNQKPSCRFWKLGYALTHGLPRKRVRTGMLHFAY